MNCNCEYCVKCECGHKADEHLAGEGQCFICNCPQFYSRAVDAWERLHLLPENLHYSFQEFIDKWISENKVS